MADRLVRVENDPPAGAARAVARAIAEQMGHSAARSSYSATGTSTKAPAVRRRLRWNRTFSRRLEIPVQGGRTVNSRTRNSSGNRKGPTCGAFGEEEADDGIRTHDLLHGKRVVGRPARAPNTAWLQGFRCPRSSLWAFLNSRHLRTIRAGLDTAAGFVPVRTSVIVGYVFARLRGATRVRSALGRLGFRHEPESLVFNRTVPRMPSSDGQVTVTFKDDRVLAGAPRFWHSEPA